MRRFVAPSGAAVLGAVLAVLVVGSGAPSTGDSLVASSDVDATVAPRVEVVVLPAPPSPPASAEPASRGEASPRGPLPPQGPSSPAVDPVEVLDAAWAAADARRAQAERNLYAHLDRFADVHDLDARDADTLEAIALQEFDEVHSLMDAARQGLAPDQVATALRELREETDDEALAVLPDEAAAAWQAWRAPRRG